MKDKSTKRTVIVGIFILLGMVIFATGVLVLGGQKKTFMRAVRVSAVFHDIGGLKKGDNIWYSGVKVGTIKSISFLSHNQIAVQMDIDKNSRAFIHKDVKARVSADGLVGNKIIALSGGSANMPPVEDGDTIHVETSISTDEIMNTLQVNNKSLVEITGNLKVITKKIMDGEGTVGKLLTDETLYNNLEATLATLRKTAANTEKLTQGLAAYANGLQTKGSLANDLVTDTVVFANLRSTATQLSAMAGNADSVVKNLREATAGLQRDLRSPSTPAGVILNDEKTAKALKATIRNLQTSTEKLDENMEALQHNFLLRGFFRKRAKREAKEAKEAAKQQADSVSAN